MAFSFKRGQCAAPSLFSAKEQKSQGMIAPLSAAYAAIDFETADYEADSACAVGLVKVCGGRVADMFYSLIRPPRRRMYFSHIHGLTWSHVKNSPTFAELWPEIHARLADIDFLAAHNAPFDRRILHGCCAAAGIPVPNIPFVCTLRAARRALRLPSYRLDAVCAHLGIELKHHHAGADALAAARILLQLQKNGSIS